MMIFMKRYIKIWIEKKKTNNLNDLHEYIFPLSFDPEHKLGMVMEFSPTNLLLQNGLYFQKLEN